MRRLTISTFLVGIVGALALLGVLAFSGPAPRAQAADINTIAVDMDTTGNTVTPCTTQANCATAGVLGVENTCIEVPTNSVFSIDVTVDSVPAGGTAGGGFDLLFNSAVIS